MNTTNSSENFESQGRRMLAAVMFTDVVDSSRLMGDNEERTMILIDRDLKIISDLCKQFNGRILKLMGDGSLAVFQSGVYAVECAQEIQRHFSEHARTLPPEEVLQHRIGIHLGDVYISDDEVMGDGVNIAARLQSEAPAGGICISQALYEVIKTRLSMHTVYLGPKQLKNIKAAVHIYHVTISTETEHKAVSKPEPGSTSIKRLKAVLWGFAVLTLLLAGIVTFQLFRKAPINNNFSELSPPPGKPADHIKEPVPLPPPVNADVPSKPDPAASITEPPGEESDDYPAQGVAIFRRLDKNRDGKLMRHEVPVRLWKRIVRADRNHDGAVTLPELKAGKKVFDDLRRPKN